MPVSLTDLPAGHVFTPAAFTVDGEAVLAYRDAVDDGLAVYAAVGAVPPLAVAALALGALLREVSLPAGSLHASESVRFQRVVPAGAMVECRASLAHRSLRAGWVVSVLESEMLVEGEVAVTARATVMSPAAGS